MESLEVALRNRTVFVTGGTGLVGSHLVRRLLELQAEVILLVRDQPAESESILGDSLQRATAIRGELESFETIERAINRYEPSIVFHLAAQPIVSVALRNPLQTFEANVRGTYNLLEACKRHASMIQAVVVASSDKAYGESEVLPYLEDMPPLGRRPYDVSKSCGDLIARSYFETYGLPVVVTRCGNIFGPGDRNWNRLIPGTLRSLFLGETPIVRSDGMFQRDYLYVLDVVDAYLRCAAGVLDGACSGQALNFSCENPKTVLDIMQILQRLMNREDLAPQILDQAQQEIRDQYLSAARAKEILNWSPVYGLEDGLAETTKWYCEYFERKGLLRG